MDPNSLKRSVLAIVLAIASSLPGPAWSFGWFHFDPVRISARIEFTGIWQETDTGSKTNDLGWGGSVGIAQNFYVLHPDIARFSFFVEPRYFWQKLDTTPEPDIPREAFDGEALNYTVSADFLTAEESPVPVDLHVVALRNYFLNTGALGSRTETTLEDRRVYSTWRNGYFPLKFEFIQTNTKQDIVSGFDQSLTQRDDQVTRYLLSGRSSKMTLDLEHSEIDDRFAPSEQEFALNYANLSHWFAWGRSSTLNSNVQYSERTGFQPFSTLVVDEIAFIYHTPSVSSRTRYAFSRSTSTTTTDRHRGEFSLFHRLYQNLTTRAFTEAEWVDGDDLGQTRWLTGLDSKYRKSNLFYKTNVSAGALVSYGETDLDSNRAVQEVFNESHVVPLNGIVTLRNRYAQPETVSVTNAAGTLIYNENFDYTVTVLSGGITQLRIVPGGRIDAGQTILANYRYAAFSTQDYSTTLTNFDIGISRGSFSAYHGISKTNYKTLSGDATTGPQDFYSESTSVSYGWRMRDTNATVTVIRNYAEAGDFDSTSYVLREYFSGSLFNRANWHLNIAQDFSRSDEYDSDTYSLDFSVNWSPTTGMTLQHMLGAWRQTTVNRQGGVVGKSDNDYITFSTLLQWNFRQVTVNLSYEHNRRNVFRNSFNDWTNKEDRLSFNMIRRFW